MAEFELNFVPRHVVKSQVLADFIVDWTPSVSPQGAQMIVSQSPELWSSLDLFDGSSRKQGAARG
jgi:hypothetical protein